MKILKTLRVILAVLSITAITLVFVDFTGVAAGYLSWLPKIQLVPALLALNVVALAILAALTLLAGRVYCSVICPLGIWQDIVNYLLHIFTSRKKRRLGRFRYEAASTRLRIGFLIVFAVLLALGLAGVIATSLAGILDPYSAYGRMAGQFAVPLWRSGMSMLADKAAESGHFIIDAYPAAAAFNIGVLAVAIVTFVVTTSMAWAGGRAYCNKVCPVGTILGFLSRYSLLRITIDTDRCNRCGSCGRKCKASCIDTKNHIVDISRCVDCMDCIGACSQGAISFAPRRKATVGNPTSAPDTRHRAFLVGSTIMAGSLALRAADKATDGGLAPIKAKKPVAGSAPAVPPGAISVAHLRSHCTACQLCISACPNGVLKPSSSLNSFMQPVMEFTAGYCRPECTTCADICPAGAIKPISAEEKTAVKIGTAVVNPDICISAAYGQHCGSCARHCPTQAITMVKTDNGNKRPAVDETCCIGCGSCEYHCPSGAAGQISASTAAIHVEGSSVHTVI